MHHVAHAAACLYPARPKKCLGANATIQARGQPSTCRADAASESESDTEAKVNHAPPSRRASAAYIESKVEEAPAKHDADGDNAAQPITPLGSDGD